MSFKTKRWAQLRTVDMAEFVPGIRAYRTVGTGGINTQGWAIAFQGRVVVLAYSADDEPIWCVYDPATHTLEAGPTVCPEIGTWSHLSATFGWSHVPHRWRDDYLLFVPRMSYYYGASPELYGFDSPTNLLIPDFRLDDYRVWASGSGISVHGGMANILIYRQMQDSPYTTALTRGTLYGSEIIREGGSFYFNVMWGSARFLMREFDGYYVWDHEDGTALYDHIPENVDDPYLALGSWATNWTPYEPAARYFIPHPTSDVTHCYNAVETGGVLGDFFWATTDDPLTPTPKDWQGSWGYFQAQDGLGYEISDGDLDGRAHDMGTPIPGPAGYPITYSSSLGWYFGLGSDTPTSFTVWVLDPFQPAKMSKTVRRAFSAPSAFMGDYGIGDDLKLAHVLPFPDGRSPSGTNTPPQDRNDGFIIGSGELFARRGNQITYKRPIKMQFDYAFTDDWWMPGENPDHTMDYLFELFSGQTTILGLYPDPTWGGLDPLARFARRGLGTPEENLHALEPAPTHILRESQVLAGTRSWATTSAGKLKGCVSDPRMTYGEHRTRLGAAPWWNALGGMNSGGTWETIVDFKTMDMPELGQDGWTVMGLCTIPACRSLPRGGWLVEAQLYFAPWESWEWDPGARDLTFRDTGWYGVPAKFGYIGPLEIEEWHPKLYTAYDEWTAGRSDYGPTALIVYDYDGAFVECLNTFDLYPPDYGNVMVLPGDPLRFMYRVKGGGTYSDSSEYWGCYQNTDTEADMQAPLFAVYELEKDGEIVPGAGRFCGFVDVYELGDYEPREEGWRWDALAATITPMQPRLLWSPYSAVYVKQALGGSSITIMSPGPGVGRSGVKGVGRRA